MPHAAGARYGNAAQTYNPVRSRLSNGIIFCFMKKFTLRGVAIGRERGFGGGMI
jgi:hypothetical protein